MVDMRILGMVLIAGLLAGSVVGSPVLEQTAQAQNRLPTPPPGARSPLSPPETNKVQAEAFRRGYEAYYRGEYEQAASVWTRLADQGHVKSMNNLGTMYAQGKGVSRNFELAVLYYRRAATRNDARAAYNLGLAYERGRGVVRSDSEAVSWYRKAADRGLVEAMDQMAWVLATSPDFSVRDGAQAVRWAQAAIQRKTSSKNLATLAAAQAEMGDYRQAVNTIDQAIAYTRREVDGAGLVALERDLFGLLRNAGRTEDLFDLLERREFYVKGQPTRD